MKLSPQTTIGPVALTVKDGDRVATYYRDVIGLQELQRHDEVIQLGVADRPLVLLHVDPAATVPTNPQVGLYHLALLVPSRLDLALTLRHLIAQNEPLGASDHGASEALYLNDPEGNGIEIYADRPRDQWPYDPKTGQLAIGTSPLDGRGVLSEIGPDDQWRGLPAGTEMGHVHLRVPTIPPTKAFYIDDVGFDFMMDYGGSASFISVGGYHHHLGFNSWETAGKSPADPHLTGLKYFTLNVPAESAASVATRLAEKGALVERRDDGWLVTDPAGIKMVLHSV